MIDLQTIHDFLDPEARAALDAELRASAGAAATVLAAGNAAGVVHSAVRRSTRVAVSPETRQRVKERLMERKGELEAHFGVSLSECEDPQFLRYQEGDYFVAHQDGNTPMVYDDSRFRRVSAVIFMTPRSDEPAEGTYGGGELVFHGPYTQPNLRVSAEASPGTLVAFRAETTHEVTPVTHGERYTIVTWFR
ncbi:MAG TPA: 2OG-Fe(II) oxygenase [Longimicrobium sp.]|nr:2OG-Fe(II) oxygenase [Longimicrobium sp.]